VFVADLTAGDAKSWAIVGGSFAAYMLYKRATAPAEDPRPAGKHIAKMRKQYPFMSGMIQEEYFGEGLLAIKVKENDVIVDIGAHFGLFTLESFALSNHTSKHYCFEPIPQIREKLEDTVSGLTAPGSDQIKIFPFGLGKEDASFQFTYYAQSPHLSGYKKEIAADQATLLSREHFVQTYYDPDCPEYHKTVMPNWFAYLPQFIGSPLLGTLYEKIMAGRPKAEEVECKIRKLSQVLKEEGIDKIDILKVDVEGAELDVMKGMSTEDWKMVQTFAVEVHDGDSIRNLAGVRDILTKNGFTDIRQVQDPSCIDIKLYQLVATRPSGCWK